MQADGSSHPGREDTEHSVSPDFIDTVSKLAGHARDHRHRRAIVLSGAQDWCIVAAETALRTAHLASTQWFSDRVPAGASAIQDSAALHLLGTELDGLVFDAWSGFDPDAFGALAGTIRAGGMLLLLTPPFSDWPRFADPQNRRITVAPHDAEQLSGRFLQRLVRVIQTDPNVLICEQGALTAVPDFAAVADSTRLSTGVEPPCRTVDQQRAVEAVKKVVTGHRRRPVVLTSDRGRGKSAAFGIAAAQLILAGRTQILLTGPRLESVTAVLEHARALLPEQDHDAIRFVAPDELLRNRRDADLVLVDEAAAIPTPLLEALLKRYARIAFATTVHGYEGTGRGFAVRFNRVLDNNTNSWKSIVLSSPIRWAADDPLERFVFRMLLLDANAAPDESLQAADIADSEIECLDRGTLIDDETTLSELFGLLVLAHYRTRPLDLRHLLDGPNLSVYVSRIGGHVAATALVAEEGGFDPDTSRSIWAGRTRPHGHLLPETLAAHLGLLEAPQLRCARIMRIAVHPSVQGRGLGTRLIQEVTRQALGAGYDYIGSSFGASSELLDFWSSLGWAPVRLSIRRGASSGSHSAVMLQGLNARGTALAESARERFFANFPHQLSDSLRDLDPELVGRLMRGGSMHTAPLTHADGQDLRAFADEQRLLEVSIGSVWRLACRALADSERMSCLDKRETALLVARVLQKHSWQHCAGLIGVPGRAQALAVLRHAVAKLIR
ncbi:tRNA(Met) cytidine acetyltransferase TmcA [Thiogranum longum]